MGLGISCGRSSQHVVTPRLPGPVFLISLFLLHGLWKGKRVALFGMLPFSTSLCQGQGLRGAQHEQGKACSLVTRALHADVTGRRDRAQRFKTENSSALIPPAGTSRTQRGRAVQAEGTMCSKASE